jgi:glycosyltransferase involved in cell wall biosynthesis
MAADALPAPRACYRTPAFMSLKLSIVTPSFNHGRFLEQTIKSVAGQDYDNVEHIVVDGGSRDESVEILRKYDEKLAWWVSEPDEGHRYALQKGFDRATGDVVAWQNADDYYEPNVFGEVMEIFARHPEIDLVYGNVRIVDENSAPVRELRFVPTSRWATLFEHGFTMHNQGAFFRRSLWDAMGGVTLEDFFFDYDLFLRAMRIARPHFIHRVLGNYRSHPVSQHFSGKLGHLETDPWTVRRRYLGRLSGLPTPVFAPLFLLALVRRSLWHARLGDWDYLAGGVRRRILKR